VKLTDAVIKKVILKALKSEDYHAEILSLINTNFMEYAIDFFGRVAQAKLRNDTIGTDWHKKEFFTNPSLSSKEMIINSGLNRKTVDNSFGSSSRKVVLEVIPEYYDTLRSSIHDLAINNQDIDITLTIKFRGVSVDLNITESLIVINTLAVKRAELRGGAWSTTGKSVEKYLMLTLCYLFEVPPQHYDLRGLTSENREVDFFIISENGERHFCEVKLMGKGNPESADAVIARDSAIFIADSLSDANKVQLSRRRVYWVELRSPEGYRKFYDVLLNLSIPAEPFDSSLDEALERIFGIIFE